MYIYISNNQQCQFNNVSTSVQCKINSIETTPWPIDDVPEADALARLECLEEIKSSGSAEEDGDDEDRDRN